MTLRSFEPSDGAERAGTEWRGPGAEVTERAAAERLAAAMEELRRAGWYWGNMNVAEAKERLQDTPEGTFLVRDSSHSEYLLTISVKTSAGPTNLRIEYQDGKFRLDSIICVRSRLKQFDSVVHLIEYYVLTCKDRKTGPETPSNGIVHLYLNKPLYTSTPSLQHQCRITINKCTDKILELPLPTRLKEYLKEYQYQNPSLHRNSWQRSVTLGKAPLLKTFQWTHPPHGDRDFPRLEGGKRQLRKTMFNELRHASKSDKRELRAWRITLSENLDMEREDRRACREQEYAIQEEMLWIMKEQTC
ncbi:suppressor of cytokine signaling 2 isoform X1 [Gopherus flavomarginatus]|uniref:suppressor of cytokine signaling 2 isoform X1 n=1 Tax=Gopherus flavomarginatus TaxID=286002 RepID=UPI0021CC4931|nr:suppressor of cytokine signaling 2 isoform X1 [Gopherus flavomarginatus]